MYQKWLFHLTFVWKINHVILNTMYTIQIKYTSTNNTTTIWCSPCPTECIEQYYLCIKAVVVKWQFKKTFMMLVINEYEYIWIWSIKSLKSTTTVIRSVRLCLLLSRSDHILKTNVEIKQIPKGSSTFSCYCNHNIPTPIKTLQLH